MKPSLLKVKGINSFNHEQTIDFARLVEKGLFGIFGPTGSGKSSILDAITLALYGNIARDTREFINTECDEAQVSFDFQILEGKNYKTYRLERQVRRRDEGIVTALARMMEVKDGEINILAEGVTNVNRQVVKIIGLNSDDFTRSVVLPQGKFSEFLKLTGRERRNMLERIFGLEQYGKDLMDKINGQRRQYTNKKIDLEGQLKGYEGITEEYYKEAVEKLEGLLKEEDKLKAKIEKLSKEYEEGKRTWDLQEELKLYEIAKKELEGRREEIERKRSQLTRGQKANLLKAYITNLKDLLAKIASNRSILEGLEDQLPRVEAMLKEAESNYNEILKYKEEEFPGIIVKIENCKQAETLDQENEKLIKETEELEKKYTYNLKGQEEKNKQVEGLKIKRAGLQEKIKNIEKYLEEIYIEPHIKEALEEAYILEKEVERMTLERKEDEELCRGLSKVIENNRLRLVEEEKTKEKLDKLLDGLTSDFRALEDNPLKEEGIIFNCKVELDKKKDQLKLLKQNLENKSALVKEIESLLGEKLSAEKNQNTCTEQINKLEKQVEKLKIEIKSIERETLAAQLADHLHEGESCPVCGSKDHPKLAEGTEGELLEVKNKKLSQAETNLASLNERKTQLDISLAQIGKEEDMKKSSLEEVEKLIKDQSTGGLDKEIKDLEKELLNLTGQREAYLKEKAKIEEAINKNREAVNKLNTSIAELNMEIQKDEENLNTLTNKIDKLSKDGNLKSLSLENIKNDLGIQNIMDEYRQMKAWDKERTKKDKDLRDLRKTVEEENKQIEGLEQELNALSVEIGKNKQQLDENKRHIALTLAKINKLAENKRPGQYRIALENKIKEIEEKEKNLKVKVERKRALQQKIAEEKAIAENNRLNLADDYKNKKLQLEEKIKNQGFNSLEEVEGCLLEEAQLKQLENQITVYDDEVKKTDNNIKRVSKALDGKSLTAEAWAKIQQDLGEKKNIQEEKTKAIGETQQIVNDLKAKLKTVKELKKEEKKISHMLDLLSELSKMLEGNRFVEYVAINQLKYIAREASKWLKEITLGRYALELDSNGNFVMRDDFNGGIRRATNTLSGGETFLTSLSLALALSSHIQLKGSAPLEFFFLDEGFGTLDNDLLEVVMNALERLHSEKLSVGIISHVEELKNRVPIKLIVSPPQFGGEGTLVTIL